MYTRTACQTPKSLPFTVHTCQSRNPTVGRHSSDCNALNSLLKQLITGFLVILSPYRNANFFFQVLVVREACSWFAAMSLSGSLRGLARTALQAKNSLPARAGAGAPVKLAPRPDKPVRIFSVIMRCCCVHYANWLSHLSRLPQRVMESFSGCDLPTAPNLV